MFKIKEISSVQNPLIKKVLVLKEKSRQRISQGLFILEGQRELQLAIKGGYQIQTLLFSDTIISENDLKKLVQAVKNSLEIIKISQKVYEKIAYRKTTEGVLAIAQLKSHALENLKLTTEHSLILVAEAPEKPGNIGALLRTADAANLDGVIIANPKGDIYNPNIIRSSVGCIFTTQIAIANTAEVIEFLKTKNIDLYCMALSASKNYSTVNFTNSSAIIVGTEATGLSENWLKNATQNIIIPMQGEIDSMNVSVSAAIVIFEALRQRAFNSNA